MGKLYVGVSGTARRVKKMYVGVNGVARKVKKLYVGVNGIARKVFGGGIVYIGTTTDGMSAAGSYYRATCNENYAMFAGRGGTVCAYNSSLTLNTTASLKYKTDYPGPAHVGNYGIFAGGYSSQQSDYIQTVNAFNLSLTRTNPTNMATSKPYRMAGTNIGNYALFWGSWSGATNYDVYSASLTRSSVSSGLPNLTIENAATHNNSYAIFAGGWNGNSTYYSYASAVNSSLTVSYPSDLSNAKKWLSAAHAGEYALFAAGRKSSGRDNTVEAFNDSLTKSTLTALSQNKDTVGGTAIAGGEFALFAGGNSDQPTSGAYYSNVTEAYDTGLVKTIETSLSSLREVTGATHIGDYALFGGSVVDVYQYE